MSLKLGLLIAALCVTVLALMLYSTLHGRRYRVNVCMAYEGRSACKTVSSQSEAAALRGGTENACADIASGVTATIRCESSDPKSVRWLSRPR